VNARAILLSSLPLVLACARGQRGPEPTPAPSPVEAPVARPPDPASEPDPPAPPPETTAELAVRIAQEEIILDGHIDVPWRLEKSRAADGSLGENVAEATTRGDFDWPRAREGGLDAPFMSIYVAASFEKRGAKKVADGLIDMVEGIVRESPEKFALARSPADVRANAAAGKISLPMGMENGSPIEGKLANVAWFHGRGIRYITLAHSKDNHICDSSYDTRHTHHGLSRFGKKVVAEMNRVGIMVDVSHLSDEAFDDVLATSVVPVIASHSSCRHFTPGWERNMSDDMIRRLAEKGGVIQINFGSAFLSDEARKAADAHEAAREAFMKAEGIAPDPEDEHAQRLAEWDAENPPPRATVEDVADHIEHVVRLVGPDHVGLGSDFDGVGDSLPEGLRDVSDYPNLIRVLLERGVSREDIVKICSGNVLRVWQAVEDHAASGTDRPSAPGGG
jgi:membrane dipeptidase